MEKITTPEEFSKRADALHVKMAVIHELFVEANELVKSVDPKAVNDDTMDEFYEIAHEIAYVGGYEFADFGPNGGYWLPSTC